MTTHYPRGRRHGIDLQILCEVDLILLFAARHGEGNKRAPHPRRVLLVGFLNVLLVQAFDCVPQATLLIFPAKASRGGQGHGTSLNGTFIASLVVDLNHPIEVNAIILLEIVTQPRYRTAHVK